MQHAYAYSKNAPRAQQKFYHQPKVDVRETDDHFFFIADLPGVKREDVKIELEGEILSISAENKKRRYHRQLSLPEPCVSDGTEAKLEGGVLKLRLQKSAPLSRSTIEIV